MVNIDEVLTVDGCGLHYADSGGDGVPVVFTHGAGADHVLFEPQRRHLAALGYRVITWDLRGHGRSRPAGAPFTAERAVADLCALIGHLELDRPVLIGQSLGGNLGQAVVKRRPELARALVVVDSAWNAGPLSRWERALLGISAPLLAMVPVPMMADASAVTPAARADARRAFAQVPKREFVQVWRATVELLEPDPGYRTPVPLCLIRGERDRTGNIAAAMPRWAAAEGIEEIVIPGAGHISTQDAPDAVNAAIAAFLGGSLR
ncbi:alpha/beta hydrolase [Nonomuraea sp. NBC_01738]|uniref:alpha/beta fold hydrolase n=1 Tax=Nonomuraea sp. NBC_01738 TaxID=2976003 RepID=UPI002E133CE8|nr:alpha/beta hydrolase [Nonomuraea sp. NBC_01738]